MSNINKIKRAPIMIQLDREREIRYTLNSLAEMEEKYGTVEKALEAVSSESIKAVRFMLWVGQIDSEDALTEKQVGSYIDLSSLNAITEKLSSAIMADLPENKTAIPEDKISPNV